MTKPKTPNQKSKYSELNKRLAGYVSLIQSVYETLNMEAAKIVENLGVDDVIEEPFSFSHYPETQKKMAEIQKRFVDDIWAVIYRGTSDEWKKSNDVQDLLANNVLKAYEAVVDKEKYKVLYQTNSDALKAFQNRKDKGFNVSEKLWNQSVVYKKELEDAISCAIEKGMSAVTLSKRISKYLQDFPQLQRDYRDKFGIVSKAMDCEYRSIRLAASEINMAYRTAENKRWEQMDFVVGYEIKLSGNHTLNGKPFTDICDSLAGKYPKDFVWTGWHPLCRCYKIPILKTEEEFWSWDGRSEVSTDSVNSVKDVPENFKQWVGANSRRIAESEKRGTLPYFILDNLKRVDDILTATPLAVSLVYSIGGIEQLNVLDGRNYELTKNVSDVENSIRMNKGFETGAVFNANGDKVIDKRGEGSYVRFTKEELSIMKDCIFTHNHPGGWEYADHDIGRIGNSFSIQDIVMAVGNNLSEMRAVTPNYTFSMKRPQKGWGISVERLVEEYNKENTRLRKEFTGRINNGTLTISQANATHFHILWRNLSEKLGFEYYKMKTK